ncbi:MAG: UDP-2,4-diacetamido-2,4,6-trideoxy-beta-L-altropyranose hydrolase [Dinghuibacter sp.]|nr:UDP-2,4-diacetamido-2,4,6-trideoxy-beta-L-altropyranose hydrolase [Dinghuibacter sp.]
MTVKRRIVIRAEGGPSRGMGHIFRCMALAEMLRDHYEICFSCNYLNPEIEKMLRLIVHETIKAGDFKDSETEFQFLKKLLHPGNILVLDGYCFDTELQQLIKQIQTPLVCIDDIHAFPFVADVVINHSGGFSVYDYQMGPHTKLYTGLQYCLLRKPFREAATIKKNIQLNNNCLVCFGGADPANDTLHTIRRVREINPKLDLHVVTGSAYPYGDTLMEYKNTPGIHFYEQMDAASLCELMQQCGMAITPPSTTSYEYLSVKGLLYLKVIAGNQERMFEYLTGNRLALPLESFGLYEHPLTKIDNETLNLIFDGKQQSRLLQMFSTLNKE